ncbi:hypothetical protein BT93_B3084 [Corymbia citriodora subsp. variegata]|nr:hypothetical protein BT93_B3084 [Corymbia citriodora subsp. variegata]
MAFPAHRELLLGFLVIVFSLSRCLAGGNNNLHIPGNYDTASLNRSSFPSGFLFGTSSAAYQHEGAANEDGKGPSIWDYFTHKYPEKISDGSNGDVAIDQYHRYKEDVGIMKEMGLDAYRFSISWPRILPKGKLKGGINREGVRYYNNLINELLAHGIQPFVTLFHYDLPQTLEEEYGGFLSPLVVDDFHDYVGVCFEKFGDRVKHWITLNEPWSICYFGYTIGTEAPGRCSAWQMLNCTDGDSGTEPYIVAHYQILAHAAAVKLYREKYQASQKGIIGITLVSGWFLPYSNAKPDRNVALRALDFNLGWFMEPITYGDYPHSMRALVGGRLPNFTKEQSLILLADVEFVRFCHRDGVRVKGYFVWSLLDNFEWASGYTIRFGINYVDFQNGLKRIPKRSAYWFKSFLKKY